MSTTCMQLRAHHMHLKTLLYEITHQIHISIFFCEDTFTIKIIHKHRVISSLHIKSHCKSLMIDLQHENMKMGNKLEVSPLTF
jgi:hypothetical protein